MRLTRVVTGLLAAVLLAGWAEGRASAGMQLLETNAVLNTGVWTYTYSVTLSTGSQINSGTITSPGAQVAVTGGDFFALVDFNGYVASSANVSGLTTASGATWQVVTSNLGLLATDGATVGTDSSSIINVNFQYVGTGLGANTTQSIVGNPTSLGSFTLQSTLGPGSNNIKYQAQGETIFSPPTDQSNQGSVTGPVPEPASLSVLALGAVGLLLRRRR